jgi:ADP-ribosylglycohydrolase
MPDHPSQDTKAAFRPEQLKLLRRVQQPGQPTEPPRPIPIERFEAMMLCLAIGDSLGNPSESQLPAVRYNRNGEITNYILNREAGDARGYPSDDTQMAFWTLEHLIEYDRIAPGELLNAFSSRNIFGIGATVRKVIERHHVGIDWAECGVASAGNGALMRIAPLLYHALVGRSHLLVPETILATALTHNDSMAVASSIAAVQMLGKCCCMERVPPPEWWAEEFIRTLKDHETGFQYRSRAPGYAEFRGSLWQFLKQHLLQPSRMSGPLLKALDWYSGAYLLETVPTCLLILMRHAHDPEQAMVRAVNDTKDNDTVAAIVGAFLGALHGKEFLPKPWVNGLVGRTREDDDGAVFRILELARKQHLLFESSREQR